ncbi:MAG: hypothetical protein M1835_007090 [Candelina submexicana]|nr:MAG: hypothetical protein M1835_001694 [Candelina submexicana]KAI9767066.1 MAG: hypothetical protein M1835_007090 [Candelina submexicana]
MALQALPIELHQQIAIYIESDKDLCAFTLACRQTHAAVLSPGVWRKRFARRYDPPLGKSNHELKQTYQWRARVLAQGTIFRDGHGPRETRCLELIRDLIVESLDTESPLSFKGDQSRNVGQLHQIVLRTNLLHDVFRNGYYKVCASELLLTLQLALTHWSFDPKLQAPTYGWEFSQKVVYQPTDEAPVFSGTDNLSVNMAWLLHVANFFKYHLTRRDNCSLYYPFLDLEHYERPGAWRRKIQGGLPKVGKYWRGIYAYIDDKELRWVREMEPGRKIVMDEHGSGIQDIEFEFGDHVNSIPWPEDFEIHLHSTNEIAFIDTHQRSISSRSLRFQTSGLDWSDSYGSGHIQEIPPQQGIPGWQRFTMMKYHIDENGFYLNSDSWAYEGVVLPGSQIILGRWWHPQPDPANDGSAYSGPFLFWAAEDEDEVDFQSDSGYGSNGSPT